MRNKLWGYGNKMISTYEQNDGGMGTKLWEFWTLRIYHFLSAVPFLSLHVESETNLVTFLKKLY